MSTRTTQSTGGDLPGPAELVELVELEPPTVDSGTYEQWIDAAAAVLRKMRKLPADSTELSAEELSPQVIGLLARTTADGVQVPPLGRRADVPAGLPAGRRSPRAGAWDIRSAITVADPAVAAATALAELEGGATSVIVRGAGSDTDRAGPRPDELATALAPVLLDIAAVVLDPTPGTEASAAQAFSAILRKSGVTPAAGSSFGVDPVGALLTGPATAAPGAPDDAAGARYPVAADGAHPGDQGYLAEILAAARELSIGAVAVDGTRVHELGGSDVTEIGWSIAVGIATLRLAVHHGLAPDEGAQLISFRYAVTDDQFGSIAKLRAARAIWARVLELSGVDAVAHPQYQHAVTSRPMTSRYDPWVNLLRGTVATFAAGVAGAQAVTTLPFDAALGLPDAFGRRLARNVSHLLIGESRVAEVADPAGGSAAVEQLTDQLAVSAWELVQQIEAAGGAAAAGAVALVRERANAERSELERRIATRRVPLTGVSEFPHLGETLPNRPPGEHYDGFSWPSQFEALRDSPCATPVFLATLGPVAAHATRAGFVSGALAASGINVVLGSSAQRAAIRDPAGQDPAGQEPTGQELIELVAAFREAATPVAVLVGTDDAYAERGASTIAALRKAGAGTVLLAGKPSAELEALLDGSIALGADIPALGLALRAALEGKPS